MFCPTAAQTEVKMRDAFLGNKVLLQSWDWLILSRITLLPPTNHNQYVVPIGTEARNLAKYLQSKHTGTSLDSQPIELGERLFSLPRSNKEKKTMRISRCRSWSMSWVGGER